MSNFGLFAFVIAIVVCFLWATDCDSRACKAQGGHLVWLYKSAICVSADGKILN